MIKNSSRQNGSMHVVIIVILIVALLGALGFVFWQNFTQKSEEKTANQSTTKNESKPKEDDGLLKLADWGIEFTIPDGLKTTTVKYSKSATKDTPPQEVYVFTTARIQALGGECAKSP